MARPSKQGPQPAAPDLAATDRVLRVLRRLMCSPATIRELSELHDVDQRTIRRDLRAIRAAGFGLRFRVEQFNRRVWRVSQFRGRVE